MKKVMLLFVLLSGMSAGCAQSLKKGAVPQPVQAAFMKLYPAAKEVKWGKEKDKFEAEFDLNKTDQSALFDASGNLTESEVAIKISELPKGVAEYVEKNFKSKIKEAARITDAAGTITYEAEVKGKDLIFDANGNFLKIAE